MASVIMCISSQRFRRSVIAIAAGMAVCLSYCEPCFAQVPAQQREEEKRNVVVADPDELNFGEAQAGVRYAGSFKVTNTGTKTSKIIAIKGNCGTRILNTYERVLGPGASTEIHYLKYMGSGKRMEAIGLIRLIADTDKETYRIIIKGKSVLTVCLEPRLVNLDQGHDGKVTLSALDGEPFRILDILPPLEINLPSEARTTHEIQFTKDTIKSKRRVFFEIYLDKPDCEVVKVEFRNFNNSRKIDPQIASLPYYSFYRVEDVNKAIASGIDITKASIDGQTPLMKSVLYVKVEPPKALIDAGAPLDAVDRHGKTALMQAVEFGRRKITKLLVTSGANVSLKDNVGSTALHWAARYGDRQMIQVLLLGGADIEVIDDSGFRALHRAVLRSNFHSTKALIENKADINAQSEGRLLTPLMCAARQGSIKIIKALLDAGADLDATDQNGRTALDWALEKNRRKAVQMLEAAAHLS